MSERVAVIGSREHPNLEMVREYVRSLPAGTVVISGGAVGVDTAARAAAGECGLTVTELLPDAQPGYLLALGYGPTPNRMGVIAPVRRRVLVRKDASRRDVLFFRNTWVAALCDRMAVFPDGSKGGAWDAAREAVRFRRPVEVRWVDGRVEPFTGSGKR